MVSAVNFEMDSTKQWRKKCEVNKESLNFYVNNAIFLNNFFFKSCIKIILNANQ